MEREFNINHSVRVQLFEAGEKIFRDHYAKSSTDGSDPLVAFRMDPDGWVTLQMWAFMEIFGPHTLNQPLAFNFNIRILFPDDGR